MKKIYLIAMLFVIGFAANAQRNITIAVLVNSPAIDANIVTGSTTNPVYYFQNLSPTTADSVQVGDTIKYFTPGSPFASGSYTGYEYIIMTRTLKKDSIMAVNGVPTTFANIQGLYDINKTLIPAPFTNNTRYYWYLRPAGVGAKAGSTSITFTPGTSDTQRIWINKSTGVNEYTASVNAIQLFPNPAVSTINFDYTFTTNESATVSILDVAGRTVSSKDYENQSGTQRFTFDVASLQSGNYFLNFVVGGKTISNKFTVAK